MKASFFALVLSLFVTSLPVQADTAKPAISQQKVIEKINLNKADAKALTNAMKGIGVKRAQAIISYRDAHGAFKSIDDLAAVKGVGKGFVKRNHERLLEVFFLG